MKAALSFHAVTAAADDRPVLATAPLHAGFNRSNLSRYSDMRWDLGPAVFRENARRSDSRVDFDTVGDPIIVAAVRDSL